MNLPRMGRLPEWTIGTHQFRRWMGPDQARQSSSRSHLPSGRTSDSSPSLGEPVVQLAEPSQVIRRCREGARRVVYAGIGNLVVAQERHLQRRRQLEARSGVVPEASGGSPSKWMPCVSGAFGHVP